MEKKKKIKIKIKSSSLKSEENKIKEEINKKENDNTEKKIIEKKSVAKKSEKKSTVENPDNNSSNIEIIDDDKKKNKKIYNLPEIDYSSIIADELELQKWQVTNTINLLDNENTIPFIARYRKEATGSLDEVKLRDIQRKLNYLRTLQNRKKEILSSILTQGKLTKELEKKILSSNKISEIEELYLPYKPKRKTKATIAKELGLEPLALIIKTKKDPENYAEKFVDPEKGIKTIEIALKHAQNIIAEEFAETFEVRKSLHRIIVSQGEFEVKKKNPDVIDEFDMYKEYKEPISSIKNHRILAINRGEKKGKLTVKLTFDEEDTFEKIYKDYITSNNFVDNKYLSEATLDGFKRLLTPSIEKSIRKELTEKAEQEAIEVFAENLKNLLLLPPLKNNRILAIDPGIRTGSKMVAIDEFGQYLGHELIFQQHIEESMNKIVSFIEKYNLNLIAIGNGTASREVEFLVAKTIKEKKLNCKYTIVAETGASIYSASDIAREEFPDLDVTVRGAISIGRRVLDPLSEFVKIDPKSLGVGEYQHDVNQKKLSEKLDEVVEDSVNKVGVLLNTASSKLLQYVAGLSSSVAKNIVKYRELKGPFKSRFDLLNVPGFGLKTFEQAAGFLRIPESKNILDNSWVHPESYDIAKEIIKLKEQGKELTDEIKKQLEKKYNKGEETINDIITDLEKPGRDPREDIEKPILKDDVLTIDDLSEGMILKGTIRNVTKFGAFVDIGLKQAGLVHISEISDEFVSNPLEKIAVGQIVNVKVIGIDKERNRVSLSMKINSTQKSNKNENKSEQNKYKNSVNKPDNGKQYKKDINKNNLNKNKNIKNKNNRDFNFNDKDTKITFGDLLKNVKPKTKS